MVLRMQYSGYSEKFWYEVVNLRLSRAREKADREGERLLHRPKEWRREEREQERVIKRSNWYKKSGNEAVIFLQATPKSQLQKRYQEEIKRQGFKIKVVEKAGVAIKKLLQRSDPFKSWKCEREDCAVCRESGRGPCDWQSVTYEIKCAECGDIYIGETSRSAYTRGKEHMKSLAKRERAISLVECRNSRWTLPGPTPTTPCWGKYLWVFG